MQADALARWTSKNLAHSLADAVLELGRAVPFDGSNGTLKKLATMCGADGSILWLWTEQETFEDRRLYPAAEWFQSGQSLSFHALSRKSPTTGKALEGTPRNFQDFPYLNMEDDPDARAAKALGIEVSCMVPIRWSESSWGKAGASAGILNFYRCHKEPFSDAEFEMAQFIAPMALPLLTNVTNLAAYDLLRSIGEELRKDADGSVEPADSPSGKAREKLGRVVDLVSQTFHCAEVSLYLESPRNPGPEVELVASTPWPWPNKQATSYKLGEGLTGYCFAEKRPIRIFDLCKFHEDIELIKKEYPGVPPLPHPISCASQVEGGKPVSFMAVPIRDKGKVIGVLRCSAIQSTPYYFHSGHKQLFGLIANHVGDWCGSNLRLHRIDEKRRWLEKYVDSLAHLNLRANTAIGNLTTDTLGVFRQGLETARIAIPNAHSCCIRIANKQQTQLGLAAHWPDLEQKWGTTFARRFKTIVLPLHGGINSAAADAFRRNEPITVPEFNGEYSRLVFPDTNASIFPETSALIVVPISSGSSKYGTIEVRFFASEDLSDQARLSIKLLGSQIGLYLFLREKIETELDSQKKLAETIRVRQEAFQNLGHQLKQPLALSYMTSEDLLNAIPLSSPFRNDARILHGLVRQASQVAWKLRLFINLAEGIPIKIEPSVVTRRKLMEMVQTAADLYQAISDKRTNRIKFTVESQTFEVLDPQTADSRSFTVKIDIELLQQMIDNLLDNAQKYSKPSTEVQISAGVTRNWSFFYISVANTGLPVTADIAKRLMQRGERSSHAIVGGQEGEGLGLYLVNKILKAHRGELEIIPTEKGVAKFRLLFPVEPRSL